MRTGRAISRRKSQSERKRKYKGKNVTAVSSPSDDTDLEGTQRSPPALENTNISMHFHGKSPLIKIN